MLIPGIRAFDDMSLTVAGTFTTDWFTNLDGVLALNAQLRFAPQSGGTSAKFYLQTSFDQGQTAIDVWNMACLTSPLLKAINLSGLTPKTTPAVPTDGALADDTVLDGILGPYWRWKYVIVGAYAAGSIAKGRICGR